MAIVPMVLMGALVWKLVDVLKYVSAQQWREALTQVIAWTSGVAVAFLLGATRFGDGIVFNDVTLGDMRGWEKVVVGLMATSLLSATYDVKKAIDGSDSAAVPRLGGE